jgi:hypothetical protein
VSRPEKIKPATTAMQTDPADQAQRETRFHEKDWMFPQILPAFGTKAISTGLY